MLKYYWSFDEEEERYINGADTIEECIKDAKWEQSFGDYADREVIYVGKTEEYHPKIYVMDILEHLECEAIEDCGEQAEDWFDNIGSDARKELEDELNEVLSQWLEKYATKLGRFSSIKEVRLDK